MEAQKAEIPREWSDIVEEAYRFQLAGYKDQKEYLTVNKLDSVDRWPHNNYVKKLRRRDGNFYYYNRHRECADKDLRTIRIYA